MRALAISLLLLTALAAAAAAPTAAASPPTCESSPNDSHNVLGYADCAQQCLSGDTFQVWPLPPQECY